MTQTSLPTPTPKRTDLISQVSWAVAVHSDLKELLRSVRDILHESIPLHYVSLNLYDPDRGSTLVSLIDSVDSVDSPDSDKPPPTFPIEDSPTAEVWRTQRPLLLNPDEEKRFPAAMAYARHFGIRSLWMLPLTTPRCRLGSLAIASLDPNGFDNQMLPRVMKAARFVALAVENAQRQQSEARTIAELTRERNLLRVMLDIATAVVPRLQLPELVEVVTGCLRSILGQVLSALWLPEPDGIYLRTHYLEVDGDDTRYRDDLLLTIEGNPSGDAFRTGQIIRLSEGELQRLTSAPARAMIERGARSFVAFPLHHQGRRLGVLSLIGLAPETFDDEALRLLQQATEPITAALANALEYSDLIEDRIRLCAHRDALEHDLNGNIIFEDIVGDSPSLRELLRQVRLVAPTDSAVLIQGETGTGKELIARAIHRLSRRDGKPFVKLNCAAIPSGLLESELFGHEKGAFTGAISRKLGRFEVADTGSLFLDEVGDVPVELQPKLLRVLQEQEFERLGSTRTIRVNVRLIAATHRNLGQLVSEGRFRADLFYRLNVFPVRVPSLRERPGDIPRLVHHFLKQANRRLHRNVHVVPDTVMDQLHRYPWPGNVRELEHLVERAVILSTNDEFRIPPESLPTDVPVETTTETPTLREVETDLIRRTLTECNGIVGGPKGAAARLGMKRTTLISRMRRLGIRRSVD